MACARQVTAEGVASEFDVWPLVGVRVPHNASVAPLLTMHNPTDHTIQVTRAANVTLLAACVTHHYTFTDIHFMTQ